jgi:nucleotidyltransferase/DNA polymerase involved in DNA repair
MAVENDLAELKGIGQKHAATLKEIGVDSIKELRHRNAANLKEMIETRQGRWPVCPRRPSRVGLTPAKAHEG